MSRKSQAARADSPQGRGLPQVRLPSLHRHQQDIYENAARFKVVVCGRQFGKTTLGVVMCLDEAFRGGDVWWVAPTYPLAEQGWKTIEKLVSQYPGTRTEGKPVWRATLPSGGTIQAKSADNPDSLRGATLDMLVVDEAAIAKPETWPTLRPTLTVREGRAMFISTPKGTNWFYDLYEEAERREGWERWRIPSVDSPFVPAGDVEEARQGMSSLLFSQEYLAEFIAGGESQFRAEWIQGYRTRLEDEDRLFVLGDEVVPLAECSMFHTVDLAWSQAEDADYTVISSWAVTKKRHLILLDVIRGHFEGPDVVPKMRLAYDKWGGPLVVERATRQMSIIQEAVRTGLPVREVKAEKDKIARSWPAQARMEQRTVWFDRKASYWRDIEQELLAFPASRHDDFVDTLSYAALQIAGGGGYEAHGLRTI